MQKYLCTSCEHYFGGLSCAAFPDRIPDEIMAGSNDHENPLPDQGNDLVFEPKNRATPPPPVEA